MDKPPLYPATLHERRERQQFESVMLQAREKALIMAIREAGTGRMEIVIQDGVPLNIEVIRHKIKLA
jgi:hypothetical protein